MTDLFNACSLSDCSVSNQYGKLIKVWNSAVVFHAVITAITRHYTGGCRKGFNKSGALFGRVAIVLADTNSVSEDLSLL